MTETAQGVRGTIAADSPREARDKLRAQGLLVEEITEQRIGSKAESGKRKAAAFGWVFTWPGPTRRVGQLAAAVRDLTSP